MNIIQQITIAPFSSIVIPQNKANRLRNVSREPVYAESPKLEIADNRLHNTPRSVSYVTTGFRND